jgi:hypothetical protein
VVTIFGPSRTLSRRSGSSVAKVSANGLSEPRSSRQYVQGVVMSHCQTNM